MTAYKWLLSVAILLSALLVTASIYLGMNHPTLRTARYSPLQYWVSLPKGWTPEKRWPILVVVDGSDHAYWSLTQLFMWARGNRPFIIVTPVVLTNSGNPDPKDYHYGPEVWDQVAKDGPFAFDEQGLLAAVDDVQALYGGADKFFISGYSAGGHLTWAMIFTHPDRLAGAALAAGNFMARGYSEVSSAPERQSLPILALQGDKDTRLSVLNEQSESASQVAKANGYGNLSRRIVRNGRHWPFPGQVLDFFADLNAPQG